MADWLQGPFVYALYASYGCLPGIPGVFQAIGCARGKSTVNNAQVGAWGFLAPWVFHVNSLRIHAGGECNSFRGWIRQQRSLWHFRWVAG